MAQVVFPIVVLILAVIFHSEVRQLVGWVVSFKKITKGKDGLTFEVPTEPGDRAADRELTEPRLERLVAEIVDEDDEAEAAGSSLTVPWYTLLENEDFDGAAATLDGLIADADDEDDIVQYRSLKGHVLFEEEPSKGETYFEALVAEHPTVEHPYVWYALSLSFASREEEGLAVLRSAEGKVGAGVLTRFEAESLASLGREGEAIQLLESALRDDRARPVLSIKLSILRRKQGDVAEAGEALRDGVHRFRRDEDLRAAYAKYLLDNGRNEEAAVQYTHLANSHPDNSEYPATLGNVWLNLELFDQALVAYEQADEVAGSGEAWILANIGNLYLRRGLHSKARDYVRRALEIDPDSRYAHTRMASIGEADEASTKKLKEVRETASRLALPNKTALPPGDSLG